MANVFQEDAEPTVSIQEYLNEVEEQELEADLVLGGDEGKECTYAKGYMKRQAIFSCLTCTPDGNAGVCTACSLCCHDGHEIVELWTKRNFKCDCGNSKFGSFFCKLFPSKEVKNEDNSYNHNFKGLYCTCGRPYPDPEVEEQVEMIQCCICEDWFHEEHIGLESSDEVPRDDEGEPLYEDFICQLCSVRCSILTLYQTIWAAVKQNDAVNATEEKDLDNATKACESTGQLEDSSCVPDSSTVDGNNIVSAASSEKLFTGKGVLEENSEKHNDLNTSTQGASSSTKCILGADVVASLSVSEKRKSMFLCRNWRDTLCRCGKCVDFYNEKGINFLLDTEDSIADYEKMAKLKRDEKLQQQEGVEVNFLSKLGHVEKMEILNGITDMKNEIHSFLESFDSSKPITSADVHQVFENLAKKKRRME